VLTQQARPAGDAFPGSAACTMPPDRGARPLSAARVAGFTLVEALITMLILSILTAFAVNGYKSFVKRARAGDAIEQLDRFRTRMEKAFQDDGNYGIGTCAVNLPTGVDQFAFSCVLQSANQAYTASAIGSSTMLGYTFTINEQGLRRTVNFPGATVPAECWMVEKNRCQ
jgi:prepilin-type N-terminal cleavage/methylation domain-containing protein